MMKKNIFTLAVLVLAMGFSQAHGEENEVYLRGFGGVNFLSSPSSYEFDLDSDIGYMVGGSVGLRLSPVLCIETEISYRRNHLNNFFVEKEEGSVEIPINGTLEKWAFMGNLIFEVPSEGCIKPYVGWGMGYEINHSMHKGGPIVVDGTEVEEWLIDVEEATGTGYAYQLLGGFVIELGAKSDFIVSYRMLSNHEDEIKNHSFSLTLQQRF